MGGAAGRALSRHAQIQHMILKKGILYEQGSLAWTQDMLELLARLAPPGTEREHQ